MSAVQALGAIARADFLERFRRPGILMTMAVTLYAAYLFVPPNHARYATMKLGEHRGIYSSAWVGALVAILATAFLSLLGFYLVKNALERDRRSGVGPLLAATPVSNLVYVLGKTASNLTLLSVVVAVLIVAAGAMQLVRGEDPHLAPVPLIAPFVLVTLPAMAVVAAVAVLFEVLPGLRGGLGNVVYFFLWMIGLSSSLLRHTRYDFLGLGVLEPSLIAACRRAYPDFDLARSPMSVGFNIKSSGNWDLATFRWDGIEWTPENVVARLTWVAAALGLCGLAAWWFDRFDSVPTTAPARRRLASPAVPALAVDVAAPRELRLTPLTSPLRFGLTPLVIAELKMMLRSQLWIARLVSGALVLASCFAPWTAVERGILPTLWILPLFQWSGLGNREALHGTEALVFSTPRPIARPLLAQWLAGVLVALAVSMGVITRLLLTGHGVEIVPLVAGAGFVPALAVALGAWSGSPKVFEVVYLLIWYMGPINRVPALDYARIHESGLAALKWGAGAMVCLGAAAVARRMRR